MEKYIFFGAGKIGKRYIEIAEEEGLEVIAFCDNNEKRWGTQYCGRIIISPVMLLQEEYRNCIVFMSMAHAQEVYKQLDAMGINCCDDFITEMLIRKKGLSFGIQNKCDISKSKAVETNLSIVVDTRECTTEELEKTLASITANNITNTYELILWESQKTCPKVHSEVVLLLKGLSVMSVAAVSNMLFTYYGGKCFVGAKEIDENKTIVQAGFEECNGKWEVRGSKFFFFKDKYSYVKNVDCLKNNGVMMPYAFWNLFREKILAGLDEMAAWVEVQQKAVEQNYALCMQPYALILSKRTNADILNEKLLQVIRGKSNFIRRKPKERVIMMDWEVAKYDTNAGHRTTHSYIQLLKELDKEVVYLVCYVDILSPYVDYYQKQGIYVVYGDNYTSRCEEFLNDEVEEITYAFINRPRVAHKYIPLLKKYPNMKIVHYGHDLHYLRLFREYELTGNESKRIESEQMKKLEYSLIEQVDYTGYPSETEVEILKKEFPKANIECFPMLYFDSLPKDGRVGKRDGLLFVGSFGHLPNVDAACWLIEEILPEIRKRGVKDKLYLVGANPTEKILSYACEDIIITGYVSDSQLIELYQNSRICIAPLRYGAGMKGKVLEAMYYGIPIVTTDIGAEGLKDVEQVICIANTISEIADKVEQLGEYSDLQLTDRVKKAQNYIMDNFGKQKLKDMFQRQMKRE